MIRSMGDKAEARKLMKAAGLPTIPGSKDVLEDVEEEHDVGPAFGYDEIGRDRSAPDVEPIRAGGRDQALVGLHADHFSELSEGAHDVAGSTTEFEQPQPTARERRAERGQ